MWSIPMDFKIEEEFILGKDRSSEYIRYLTNAAQRLEAGGVDFIVIPCNSVHLFIDEIRKSVSIPVLSIIEETGKFLKSTMPTKVGLLATVASVNSNLYQQELDKHSISVVLPEHEDQQKIGEVINKLVRDEYSEIQKKELMDIISKLAGQNLDTILLACTDLQLLVPQHGSVKIIDTMEILVNITAKVSLDL